MAYTPPGETRRKVLRYLSERLLAGQAPTLREVQEAFGFRSVESARAQLDALVREGLLVKSPGQARGYRLAEGGGATRPPVLVPLLGRVQAGDLTAAVQDAEGHLAVHLRRPRAAGAGGGARSLFALRVRGDSMTGAGILPGDIVIVRQQAAADPGDIVVAAVEGTGGEDDATVKTLRKKGARFVLEPANPRFKTIEPDPAALRILGKVIEVRRYLDGNVPLIAAP